MRAAVIFGALLMVWVASRARAQDDVRPVSPPTASVVSSRRPTLRTSRPASEIVACRDRALRRGCVRWAPGAESSSPPSDLATGSWFWRADAGTIWSFAVARAATGAHAHHAVDFDADGYDDLAAVVPFSRQRGAEVTVHVFRGGASGLDAAHPRVLPHIGTSEHFGVSLAAGDLDGDGRTDLVVSAPEEGDDGQGTVRVFRSGRRGLAARASTELTGSVAGAHLGAVIATGDVDGDGLEDLLLATGTEVRVHRGAPAGVVAAAAWTISLPGARAVGAIACGDANADGFADVAVADPFASVGGHSRSGVVALFLGSAAGLAPTPAVTLAGPGDNEGFGGALAMGDVDDDGDADLVVGAPTASGGAQLGGSVSVFLGGAPTGVESTAGFRYVHHELADAVGWDVAVGDVDGDGREEILTGAPNATGVTPPGFVAHPGLALVIDTDGTAPPARRQGLATADLFGRSVAMLDVDGDGLLDALVSSIGSGGDVDGAVLVFPGSAAGVSAEPRVLRPGVPGALLGSDLAR